jgi:hypothetical protein
MKPYAQEAGEKWLAFRAGLLTVADIVRWADEKISQLDLYDDELADIALAGNKPPHEIASMLMHISEGADRNEAIRNLLGRMHTAMLQDRGRARDFAKFLYYMLIETGFHKLSDDLHFIWGLDDEYDLAESGTVGTVDDITNGFIKETEPYFLGTWQTAQPHQRPVPCGFWARVRRWIGLG